MPHSLLKHQIEPSEIILEAIKNRKSVLINAPAGSGKTYPVVNAIRRAQELGYLPLKTPKLASIVYVAPNAARIQQHRVIAIEGVKNSMVTSYSALRSTLGELFIDWIPNKSLNGELAYTPVWREEERPDLLICDEVQYVKNSSSQQGQVILNYIKQGGLVINISFTPFQKVIEAKIVCISCGVCSENSWLEYAYGVAGNAELTANSPAAIKRIKDDLIANGSWITFKHVYWKHKAKINTKLISFATRQESESYARAFVEYKEALLKAGKSGPQGIAAVFVALLKFGQRAEILKSSQVALQAVTIQQTENKQIAIAANFIESLRSIWSNLVKLGVPKDKIGWLIGGQSEVIRQGFIDKYQRGELDYLLLTLKTGGTSISLHHELEIARPRYVILPLTWSVFDMAQVLGRFHRINSLSDTEELILGYAGTIEGDRILPRLDIKLKCLRELLQDRKQSFILDILNNWDNEDKPSENSKLLQEKILEETEDSDNDEDCIDVDMIAN